MVGRYALFAGLALIAVLKACQPTPPARLSWCRDPYNHPIQVAVVGLSRNDPCPPWAREVR